MMFLHNFHHPSTYLAGNSGFVAQIPPHLTSLSRVGHSLLLVERRTEMPGVCSTVVGSNPPCSKGSFSQNQLSV